jgi:heme-degrading monooxygenase HmoA
MTDSHPFPRGTFCSLSDAVVKPGLVDDYLALRMREIDPRMSASPGFLGRILLGSRADPSQLKLLVVWNTEVSAVQYRRGAVHSDLREQALKLLAGPLVTSDYDLLR